MIKVMPIVYVTNMEKALTFYKALGLQAKHTDQWWSELKNGDSTLALHYTDTLPQNPIGRIELAMVSQQPLEKLVAQLTESGITLERQIADETFGRSIQVRDPDGLVIQINEHDVELYI